MSKIPASWETIALAELCDRLVDGSHNPPPAVESGKPMLSARNINDFKVLFDDYRLISDSAFEVENARTQVAPNDVLLTIVGTIGRTAVVSAHHPPFALQRSVAVLKPRGISARYLAYALSSPEQQRWLMDNAKGTAQKGIYLKTLGTAPIHVAPVPEQARIVAKLEELLSDLDAGMAELKSAQTKLAQYRQSLLKAAVEGALTAQWREAQHAQNTPAETGAQLLLRILTERRANWEAKQLVKFKEQGKTPPKDWQKKYREPVQPDTTDLPQLPEGWLWASVDQCSQDESAITDGPFGSNLKSSHYQDSGPRVIRLQNIGDGVFYDAKAHISESHYAELLKHSVQKDDLIVAMLGEVLPRACMIPNGVAPAIVKADCARIRVNKALIKPEILMSQLNSKPVRDLVAKFVKGIGRPRVNLGHIRAIPIALCPIGEQLQMETFLSDAQQSIDRQNEALEFSFRQFAAQRQNILRAAFAGQLVPQDQNDEPASRLLERIRTRRLELEKRPRVRKTKQQKEITAVVNRLIDVLAEADDWIPAQEAFRRCGVADGASTDQIEEIYAELRELDKTGCLAVESVTDTQDRKLHDRLKLLKS